jgi:hypothetical protein
MAKRYVTISDLTGKPIDDDNDVVTIAVLEHPALEHPVQLDAGQDELTGLSGSGKDFVLLEVLSDGGDKRERMVLELADFEALIKSGDPQDVLENAERYGAQQAAPAREEPKRRGRGRVAAVLAPKAKGVDYKQPDNAGLIHRGRITDEEKAIVQANFDQANANRRREGQPEIDLSNPKDVAKYGLEALAEQEGVSLNPEFKS